MSLAERRKIYQEIEQHRNRPLLVYVTSKRDGVQAAMATEALPYIIEQLDNLPSDSTQLDFLIVSYGGDPMVAWRIMSLIRQRVSNVAVLIPQSAYSAATLLALGANEIIMHPNGHLGPVDMQVTTINEVGRRKSFSTEDISAFLDFVRDNLSITDQRHIRKLFEMVCNEVGSLGIGFTARSSRLAVDLGERLLALHMKDDEGRTKLRSIVENMSRKFQSHAYPVNRTEALEMGLPINKDQDKKLESLMWNLWLDLESELQERNPFSPLIELLNSDQEKILLSPVPQLDLPRNIQAGQSWYQTNLAEVLDKATKVTVAPVDFVLKTAIVESNRLAHSCVTRGKILASRAPDLMILWNAVTKFRGWEKTA